MKTFLFIFGLFFCLFYPIELLAQMATGGDGIYEIEDSGKYYWVHEFSMLGTQYFTPTENLNLEVLVVAGGGSASGHYIAGGGGAGGLIFSQSYPVDANTPLMVSVGAGGIGTSYGTQGQNGQNSQFNNLIAIGGGGGATEGRNGNDGGSGGGGSYCVSHVGGLGTLNQGYKGGAGSCTDGNSYACGGGGGAGGAGGDAGWMPGDGGSGLQIWGAWYAGGGRGSGYRSGGVVGSNGMGQTGLGGGGEAKSSNIPGGSGKNGIVIVRYEINQFNLNIDNYDLDITPTKSSPNFTIAGTIDLPEDGGATSVAVSATIGGVSRSINVPVSTNMTWQLSWNYNELSEGEYTNIEFTATSNSSTPEETTSSYTGKIAIDKTPPTCGSWSPVESPWKVSGGETFTLTSSTDADGSGLATESASVACSTGPLHGDTCPVTIFDKVGNDRICISPINRVDVFVPILSVTPAMTGWQGDKQDIIVISSDEQTSIARIAYAWDLPTLGSDCSGGTSISSGDNLRLTIAGGANPLYVCSVDLAGNVANFTDIYQYIPPVFANPAIERNVKPSNLYWNIQSVSETQSYIEIKGFFPKTVGAYNYALEYIIPTINKSYTQALRTSPFTETHFTIIIPTTDFKASKDNHTFSGPQKLKITDLDQMEATTIDHNLSFFFPIYQISYRKDFNYFIFASDNRVNEVELP